jgi:uncharacterized protein YbjT (DUF2867 family)
MSNSVPSCKKLAVILGATGTQGSSIISALLQNPTYTLRALTCTPSSPKALALSHKDVEVMATDVNDPTTLGPASAGAHVIFAVTDFASSFMSLGPVGAMHRETIKGKNIADAAAKVPTLEHFIWSTLPSASAISNAKLAVPQMDGKAAVDEYILATLPALASKTTFLYVGFYAANLRYADFVPNWLESAAKYVW